MRALPSSNCAQRSHAPHSSPARLSALHPAPSCSHPASRIAAKVVYNEFIADKNHIHMNSTRWLTLTEFVKYLGREGKCKVEETEKGWFITLIRVRRSDE